MSKLLKRVLSLVLVLAMMAGFCACGNNKKTENDKDIVILYTNDVHCGVESNIGYAGLSYLKNQLQEDNYVVLADCGDSIQGDYIGTVSNGENIIKLMNKIGYDVAIPGNHEFDYTVDTFMNLTKETVFPYLSCNITYKESGERLLDSYKIMQYGNIKIGFVGMTTPTTIVCSTPDKFQDANGNIAYDFDRSGNGEQFYKDVQEAVDSARKAGADIVVALAHLGVDEGDSPYRSTDVIAHTTGIDVMLDGHSHSVIECERVKNADGDYVLLSQTGTKLANVGMLVISKSGNISTGLVSSVDGSDPVLENEIEKIMQDYENQLKVVVAHSDYALSIYDNEVRICRNNETSLGDLIADAFRYYGNTDIGFMNGGGIRVSLAAGDITYGDLFSVMPFGNTVCTIEATGQQIKDALECGLRDLPAESGGYLDVSGLTFEVNLSIPSSVVFAEDGSFVCVDGEYRAQNICINGQPIDLEKTYTVAGSDYVLLKNGNGRTMFTGCMVLKNDGYADIDVVVDYIQNVLGGTIGEEYSNPYGNGRITVIN